MKKKYNFGGIKGMGKISGDTVIAPDLRKMSAHDLHLWKTKISRYCNACCSGFQDDPKNPYNIEYTRIQMFLRKKIKKFCIRGKDILEIIKKKRGINKSIALEDISLILYAPDNDRACKICVEYFTGNKNGKRNTHSCK